MHRALSPSLRLCLLATVVLLTGCSEAFLAAREQEWREAHAGVVKFANCPEGHAHAPGDRASLDHSPVQLREERGRPDLVLALEQGGLAYLYEPPGRGCVETYTIGMGGSIVAVDCI